MTAHEVFAIINGKDVMNTVVGEYTACNDYAKAMYGESAFAVEITQIPVQIGDTYEDGVFYRVIDGKKKRIDPIPTDTDNINTLMASNAEVKSLLEDTMTLLLELAEGQE